MKVAGILALSVALSSTTASISTADAAKAVVSLHLQNSELNRNLLSSGNRYRLFKDSKVQSGEESTSGDVRPPVGTSFKRNKVGVSHLPFQGAGKDDQGSRDDGQHDISDNGQDEQFEQIVFGGVDAGVGEERDGHPDEEDDEEDEGDEFEEGDIPYCDELEEDLEVTTHQNALRRHLEAKSAKSQNKQQSKGGDSKVKESVTLPASAHEDIYMFGKSQKSLKHGDMSSLLSAKSSKSIREGQEGSIFSSGKSSKTIPGGGEGDSKAESSESSSEEAPSANTGKKKKNGKGAKAKGDADVRGSKSSKAKSTKSSDTVPSKSSKAKAPKFMKSKAGKSLKCKTRQPTSKPIGPTTPSPTKKPSEDVVTPNPTMPPATQAPTKADATPRPTKSPVIVTDTPNVEPTSTPTTLAPATVKPASSSPTVAPIASLPTASPSSSPTANDSASPSVLPTSAETTEPTKTVTKPPTVSPVAGATDEPTTVTAFPTLPVTIMPSTSMAPSSGVTVEEIAPSSAPSLSPSTKPSGMGDQPSSVPSQVPSISASPSLSSQPSLGGNPPSSLPSASGQPSSLPSSTPSSLPSSAPSTSPSSQPSISPSTLPSSMPSLPPTLSADGTPAPIISPSTLPSSVPSLPPTLSADGTTAPTNGPPPTPGSSNPPSTSSPTSQPDGATYFTSFERGNLIAYPEWQTSGTVPDALWERTNEEAAIGVYSIRSPALKDNSPTPGASNVTLATNPQWGSGSLFFSAYTQTQMPHDDFYYYVNGIQRGSGIINPDQFQEVELTLPPGSNTVTFEYRFNPVPLDVLPPEAPGRVGAVFLDNVYFVEMSPPEPIDSVEPCTTPLSPNPDSFEDGTFPALPWSTGGAGNWALSTDNAFDGSTSIKSPNLEGAEIASISNATLQVCSNFTGGTLRFQAISSVQPPNDIFIVYIDGVLAAQLVDVNDWTDVPLGLPPGAHRIDFSYQYNVFGVDPLPPGPQQRQGAVWIDSVQLIS